MAAFIKEMFLDKISAKLKINDRFYSSSCPHSVVVLEAIFLREHSRTSSTLAIDITAVILQKLLYSLE